MIWLEYPKSKIGKSLRGEDAVKCLVGLTGNYALQIATKIE